MKATLTLDQDCNPVTLPDYLRPAMKNKFVRVLDPVKGPQSIPVPYLPAGTELQHDVLGFIIRGQAIPADDEAAAGCGLSAAEIATRQHAYRRVSAGIDPADFPLFDAGVILGYDKAGEYVPGPNWADYQASLKEATETVVTDI